MENATDNLKTHISSAIGEYQNVPGIATQARFLEMALRGMTQHAYMSEDWCAHNELMVQSYARIMATAGGVAAGLIQKRLLASLHTDT